MCVKLGFGVVLRHLLICCGFFLATSQYALAQSAADLAGEWTGSTSGNAGGPVYFRFVVVPTGPDTFVGNMVEFNTFADQRFPELRARIAGKLEPNGRVRFSKKYDGTAGVSHFVSYEGELYPQGLRGQWSVAGTTGGFVARRGVSGIALRLSAPEQPRSVRTSEARQEPVATPANIEPRSVRTSEARQEPVAAPANIEPRQAPPMVDADTSEWPQDGAKSRTISLRLNNLDDVGAAILVLPDGKQELIAAGEWSGAGGAGYGEADFTDKLKVGPNTLVVFIYNKAFSFWVGKWTFDFQLFGDADDPIWAASGGARENNVGIRYWRAFTIIKSPKGELTVKSMAERDIMVLRPVVEKLHLRLLREMPSADGAAMSVVVAAFAAAMVSDIVGGSTTSSSSASDYDDYERPGSTQSSPSPPPTYTTGFYGNCHGGAFYGC